MSAGTIHVILSVLRSILNFAAKGGVYTSEPIRYPHLAGTSQEVQIMKLANYNQLEKFFIDNISDFHFGLLLCMHTGIRVGELSGLRWEDVDFAQHKIRIQRTVIRIKKSGSDRQSGHRKIPKTILYIGPPKTEHSNREIPLPDKLLFYAKRFRKRWLRIYFVWNCQMHGAAGNPAQICSTAENLWNSPIKIHALRHQFSCRWVEHEASIPSPYPKYLDILPCVNHTGSVCAYSGRNEAAVYESDDGAGNITEGTSSEKAVMPENSL